MSLHTVVSGVRKNLEGRTSSREFVPKSSSSGAEKSAYKSLIARGSMTEVDIPAFISKQGGAAQWDDINKEYFFRYNKTVKWTDSNGAAQSCTAEKVMWFLGSEGVLARTQLVGEFGINAAAYWTVGGDNPNQWPLIRSYAQSLAPVVPQVRVEAPPSVVYGLPAALTTSASYNGSPIINATAVLQRSDSGAWVDVASGVTGPDGAVGIPFALDGSSTFRIVMRATDTTPEVVSAEFPMAVSATVTARAKTKKVKRGKKMKVATVVRPGAAGQKVVFKSLGVCYETELLTKDHLWEEGLMVKKGKYTLAFSPNPS